jgi:hypothetical protein
MLKNLACLHATLDNLYYPPNKGDYVYFEGLPFESNPKFRFTNASWAADAAMLAYARYQKTRMTEPGLNEILGPHFTTRGTIGDCFVDNASTGRGFFAGNDKFGILAFRGTEKGNNHDVKADLKIVPVDEAPLGGQPAGKVHWGFQDYLKPIWPRVKQIVNDYRSNHPTQEICITGHSLGAALATLAFHQIQDDHTSLYTFGCPRVGNQYFCRSLETMTNTHQVYRFIDHDDVVTHIPLTEWFTGYQHPKCTIFVIDPQGGIEQNPANPPDELKVEKDLLLDFLEGTILDPIPAPVADHSPVRYCHWISQQPNP